MAAPSETTREWMKLILTTLQALVIIVSAGTAAYTYHINSVAEESRAKDKAAREQETLKAVQRELRKPYEEKQLALYIEATKVVAHLASSPSNKERFEDRFWQLYYGELAFVESPIISDSMIEFCKKYFSDQTKCRGNELQDLALDLAQKASTEVQDRWKLESAPPR